MIDDILLRILYDSHDTTGIREQLEIQACIILGYDTPLKKQHTTHFIQIQLPLYKSHKYLKFHKELLKCTMLFISKDKNLAQNLLENQLKYWPIGATEKECLFLDILGEIFVISQSLELNDFIEQTFEKLLKCLVGYNFKITHRIIQLFKTDSLLEHVSYYKEKAFKIFFPVLKLLIEDYDTFNDRFSFNSIASNGIIEICNKFENLDKNLFDYYTLKVKDSKQMYLIKSEHEKIKDRSQTDSKWNFYENLAKKANRDNTVSYTIPYSENHIVGFHNGLDNCYYDITD